MRPTLPAMALVVMLMNAPTQAASKLQSFDPGTTGRIDRAVAVAIELHLTPGAVVVAGTSQRIVFAKPYGRFTYDPDSPAVRLDTIYDLASLSKPIGAATSVMILADRGQIALSDPVGKYLPGMNTPDKKAITFEQCLLHRAGFPPDNPIGDYEHGRDEALRKIYSGKLKYKPGTTYDYSDVGYIILGELVHAVSHQPLNDFAQREIFQPLGMDDTRYLPPSSWHDRIAPTQKRHGHWMIGEVHDSRAYALGGFAGHAGLFSSGPDVARFCQMILNKGELHGHRILSARAVEEMTQSRPLTDPVNGATIRSCGFDIDTKFSPAPRGERFAKGSTFGHTGYTGTSLWIDPQHDCFIVLLTNRVYPDDKADIAPLRRRLATIVADAMTK